MSHREQSIAWTASGDLVAVDKGGSECIPHDMYTD